MESSSASLIIACAKECISERVGLKMGVTLKFNNY